MIILNVFVYLFRYKVPHILSLSDCLADKGGADVQQRGVYHTGEGMVFDVVFMDPPYRQEHERRVLEYLAHSRVIYEDTLIVVEAALETEFDYITDLGLELVRTKRYKTNQHVYLRLR